MSEPVGEWDKRMIVLLEMAERFEGDRTTDHAQFCRELAAGIELLRARLEEAADERDVWECYWEHHLNTSGQRLLAIDSPLGMQWSVLVRWKDADEWERRDGPGDRKDWPGALDAARECRRIAYTRGFWGSAEDHDAALEESRRG